MSRIVQFFNMSWMSSSPPILFPWRSGEWGILWCPGPYFSTYYKKIYFFALLIITLFFWLKTDSLYPNGKTFPQNTPFYLSQTFIITYQWVFRKLWWSFYLQLASEPSMCHALWRFGQLFLDLGHVQSDKLFAVNIDPASCKEKETLSLSRRWIPLFD